MRVLVTGATGFVGRYVVAAFQAAGAEVVERGGPADRNAPALDVTDAAACADAVRDAQPGTIVHLAAQTFVPRSQEDPAETHRINVDGTINLYDAACAFAPHARFIFASSAEVYGPVDASALPVRETQPPDPQNPYARSKADAERALFERSRTSAAPAIVVRSFNAIGPGQDKRFVVSSFAHQLARIARGAEPVLLVGNLDAKRDFVDVRDVAAAYVALAARGQSGEAYNVCSAAAYAIRDVLRELILAARVPVEVRQDPARMRPSDVPLFVGDNRKLRETTGWNATRTLAQTLRDTYEAALADVEN